MKGVSLSTIYGNIDATRKQIGKWNSRRVAAAYYASNELGIDVYKILKDNPEQLEELSKLNIYPVTTSTDKVTKRARISPQIAIDEKTLQTFLLPTDLAMQAEKMAKVYPYYYIFENLLRYVIKSTFENKYQKDWWNKANISLDIKRDVLKRKKAEGVHRWVGKRGAHEIFYTTLGDLGLIINSNFNHFTDVFPNLTWIKSRVDDLEQSRNILAHNNLLPKVEIDRIALYLNDLQSQLADKLTKGK